MCVCVCVYVCVGVCACFFLAFRVGNVRKGGGGGEYLRVGIIGRSRRERIRVGVLLSRVSGVGVGSGGSGVGRVVDDVCDGGSC